MNQAQKAIINKDLKEIAGDKQVLLPMVIVPLVMMTIMPLILVITARYGASAVNGIDLMVKRFSGLFAYDNMPQFIVGVGANYMFPILFLLIPVMASSVIGAASFVGEKERKTLETLMYTPVKIQELFMAKVAGTAITAYLIALLSAAAMGIILNIGGIMYFGRLIFPNIKWILLIFWVTPAVTILGIFFMVIISAKTKTFMEAQQMSAFILLPVLLLFGGQMGGLFLMDNVVVLILGAVIYAVDYLLLKRATLKFVPEKLL